MPVVEGLSGVGKMDAQGEALLEADPLAGHARVVVKGGCRPCLRWRLPV